MIRTIDRVCEHANFFWIYQKTHLDDILLRKIDFAQNFWESYVPQKPEAAYGII